MMAGPSRERRFLKAGYGDHLMVHFQCKLYHFRSVYDRKPKNNSLKDKISLNFHPWSTQIFWSHDQPTVAKNLSQLNRILKTERWFEFDSVTPLLGPFPVEDSLGIITAVVILDCSLDPGEYVENVQCATFRRSISIITNLSQASVGGLGYSVGAYQRK